MKSKKFLPYRQGLSFASWALLSRLRACLHGGGGSQIGEVTCGGSLHQSCEHDHIRMRDYMDRQVTSPTWGPPPSCKQALNVKGRQNATCNTWTVMLGLGFSWHHRAIHFMPYGKFFPEATDDLLIKFMLWISFCLYDKTTRCYY